MEYVIFYEKYFKCFRKDLENKYKKEIKNVPKKISLTCQTKLGQLSCKIQYRYEHYVFAEALRLHSGTELGLTSPVYMYTRESIYDIFIWQFISDEYIYVVFSAKNVTITAFSDSTEKK